MQCPPRCSLVCSRGAAGSAPPQAAPRGRQRRPQEILCQQQAQRPRQLMQQQQQQQQQQRPAQQLSVIAAQRKKSAITAERQRPGSPRLSWQQHLPHSQPPSDEQVMAATLACKSWQQLADLHAKLIAPTTITTTTTTTTTTGEATPLLPASHAVILLNRLAQLAPSAAMSLALAHPTAVLAPPSATPEAPAGVATHRDGSEAGARANLPGLNPPPQPRISPGSPAAGVATDPYTVTDTEGWGVGIDGASPTQASLAQRPSSSRDSGEEYEGNQQQQKEERGKATFAGQLAGRSCGPF